MRRVLHVIATVRFRHCSEIMTVMGLAALESQTRRQLRLLPGEAALKLQNGVLEMEPQAECQQ